MAEYDGSINIKTLVDKGDFFKGINQIKDAIKSLQSTIENIGEKIGSSTTSLVGAINKKVQETATITETVSKNVDGTTQSFEESNAAAETLKETVESIENAKENINKDAESNATSSSGIKADTAKFMNAAQEFFKATNEFENTVNQTSQDLNASVVGYANAMKNNVDATKMLEEEIDKLKDKRDELSAERSDVINSKGLNPKQYNEITEELRKVNAELERLEKLKAEALKPTFLQDWERMPKFTTMLSDAYSRFVNNAVEGFARVKNAGQVGLYGIQHPLEGINRMLGVAASSAVNFAKSLGDRTTDVVSRGLKSVGSSALRAASSLVRMAGSGVISFLKRIAVSAKNAAVQLAKMVSNAVVSGIKKLGSVAAKAGKALFGMNRQAKGDSLKEGLRFLIRYGFGVRSLFMLVRKLRTAIKEAFENLAMQSPEVNKTLSKLVSSLGMLKNTLATAFQPILTAVQPMLTSMMDMLSEAMTKVGMFFAALTGQDYVYKATKANIDYAKSLDKTKKSAKEAENQLASFDKLDILKDNKDNGDNEETPTSEFKRSPVLQSIKDFARSLADMFKKGEFAKLGKTLADKINGFFSSIDWEGYGKKIGNVINKVVEFYNAFMEGIDWDNIGKSIASGLNGLLYSVDWEALGRAFSQKINAIFGILFGIVTNTDWAKMGESFAKAVWGYLGNIDWEKIGATIGTGITKISDAIFTFATTFPWDKLGRKVANGANKLFGSIDFVKVANALNASFKGVLTSLKTFISNFEWKEHGTALENGIKQFIRDLPVDDIGAVLTGSIKGIIDFILPTISDKETWRLAGIQLSSALNNLFADKEMWADVGSAFNAVVLGILEFANGALDKFKPTEAVDAIKTALGRIQWGDIYEGIKEAAKKAFKGITDFLVALLDVSPDDIATNANGDKIKAIATKIGSMMQTVGAELAKLPWGEYLSTAFNAIVTVVKGFISGLLGNEGGNGKVLLWITGGILALKAGIIPLLAKLVGALGSGLLTGINGIMAVAIAALGTFAVTGIAKIGGIIDEMMQETVNKISAQETELSVILDGYTKQFRENGVEAANEYAKHFGVNMEGGNLVDNLKTLWREVQSDQNSFLAAIDSDADVAMETYRLIFETKGAQVANAWAEMVFQVDLTSKDVADDIRLTTDDVDENVYRMTQNLPEYIYNAKESTTKTVNVTTDEVESTVTKSMENVESTVSDSLTNVESTTNDKAPSIQDNITNPFETAQPEIDNILAQMSATVDDYTGDLYQITESSMNDESRLIDEMTDKATTGAKEMTQPLIDEWGNAAREVGTSTGSMSSDVSSEMGGITSDTLENSTTQREQIYNAWDLITTYVSASVDAMRSSVNTQMNGLASDIRGAMSAISHMDWWSIGDNIVAGIQDGVQDNWKWLRNTVTNLAKSLFNTAKNALGIHSPSTLFRDGIGKMVTLGVVEGIEDTQNKAVDSVVSMAQAMADGLEQADLTAEVKTDEGTMLTNLDGVLSTFAIKVEDSFSDLISRLQSIADNVTFRVPNIAAGTVLPYAVQAQASTQSNEASSAIEASNEELIRVMIQAFNNQTAAIVNAIQQQGGGAGVNDLTKQTSKIIDEINRRARMQGVSPIIV